MIKLPVTVEVYCKTCSKLFKSSVFDEIHIAPQIPNIKEVVIKLEELKKEISKEVKDIDGNIVGVLSLKGFEFDIGCPKCLTTNKYSVKDFIY